MEETPVTGEAYDKALRNIEAMVSGQWYNVRSQEVSNAMQLIGSEDWFLKEGYRLEYTNDYQKVRVFKPKKAIREAILDKTHYGLNIYAAVLRSYYPGETVLYLSGRDCKPAKNPFNADKPTLLVKVVDGCATHTDLEEAIAPGNVFDFAALHFGIEGQALLDKINEELHLRIDQHQS